MLNSKQFSDLFLSEEEKETLVTFREDDGAIGFSITKEYPYKGILFKPLINQEGGIDSVALIKIYFLPKEIDENGRTQLYSSVSLVSKYLLDGKFRYDYDDKRSPSSGDLQAWNKALKPIDVIEIDYLFNIKESKIYSKKDSKQIEPKKYIEKLFKDHLKTARRFSGMPFRLKFNSRNILSSNLLIIPRIIHWLCKYVFSRDINKDNRNYDHIGYELFLEPVPHRLFTLKQQRELKIFGTEIPVSKHSVIITPFIFLTGYFLGIFLFPEFGKYIDLITAKNSVIATSFIIVWFVIFDSIVPHLLLSISNIIVRFCKKIRNWKIKI